jgi:glucose-6-phosphate 1-dehydrogenase
VSRASLDGPSLEVEEHGLRHGAPADSCTIVLFGASGDLARRELMPSLFELYRKHLLPERFAIIGVSPSGWTTERFREVTQNAVRENCAGSMDCVREFLDRLTFLQGDANSPVDRDYLTLANGYGT